MDIVKRAYLQARDEITPADSHTKIDEIMVLKMVRWIKLRAYAKRDWPKEFGPYPQHLESQIKD
jgi:hypothetical protein